MAPGLAGMSIFLFADDPIPAGETRLLGFSPGDYWKSAPVEMLHRGPVVGRSKEGRAQLRESPIDGSLKLGAPADIDLSTDLGRQAYEKVGRGELRCSIHYRAHLDPSRTRVDTYDLLAFALTPEPLKPGCAVEIMQDASGQALITLSGTAAVATKAPEPTAAVLLRPPPPMSAPAQPATPPQAAPAAAATPQSPPPPAAAPQQQQEPAGAAADLKATALEFAKLNDAQKLQYLLAKEAEYAELKREREEATAARQKAEREAAQKKADEFAAKHATLQELYAMDLAEKDKTFAERLVQPSPENAKTMELMMAGAEKYEAAKKALAEKEKQIAEQAAQLAAFEHLQKRSRTARDYADAAPLVSMPSKAAELLASDKAALAATAASPVSLGPAAPLTAPGYIVRQPDGSPAVPYGSVQFRLPTSMKTATPASAAASSSPSASATPVKPPALLEVAQSLSDSRLGPATGDSIASAAASHLADSRLQQVQSLFRDDGLYQPNGRKIDMLAYDIAEKQPIAVDLSRWELERLARDQMIAGVGSTQPYFFDTRDKPAAKLRSQS